MMCATYNLAKKKKDYDIKWGGGCQTDLDPGANLLCYGCDTRVAQKAATHRALVQLS